jgi:hypothetical protein
MTHQLLKWFISLAITAVVLSPLTAQERRDSVVVQIPVV